MNINVKVKPNSNKEEIQEFGNNRYLVYLKEAPEHNEANIRLINMLAHHLGVPPGKIKIKFGQSASEKLIEVL